jgi:transposase
MNESKASPRKSRQKYSPQFKDQALMRAEKEGVSQVAKDLGLAEAQLYSWRAKQKQGNGSLESQKLQQTEMSRLKRENERLQEENAFLKKVATYFTKESK